MISFFPNAERQFPNADTEPNMTNLTRRDLLKTAAAAAVAAPLASFAKDSDMDSIPIIDTHQHLWDLTKFKLPWHETEEGADVLRKSYVMSDYFAATKG